MINITRKNQKLYKAHKGAEINKICKIGDLVINPFYLMPVLVTMENQFKDYDNNYYIHSKDLPTGIGLTMSNLLLQAEAIKKTEKLLELRKADMKMYKGQLEKLIIGDKHDHIVVFFNLPYNSIIVPITYSIQKLVKEGDKLIHYGLRAKGVAIAIIEVSGTASTQLKKYVGTLPDKIDGNSVTYYSSPIKRTRYKIGEEFKKSVSEVYL